MKIHICHCSFIYIYVSLLLSCFLLTDSHLRAFNFFDFCSVLSHNVSLLAACLFTAMLLFSNSELTLPFTLLLLVNFSLTVCLSVSSGTESGREVNPLFLSLYLSLPLNLCILTENGVFNNPFHFHSLYFSLFDNGSCSKGCINLSDTF